MQRRGRGTHRIPRVGLDGGCSQADLRSTGGDGLFPCSLPRLAKSGFP